MGKFDCGFGGARVSGLNVLYGFKSWSAADCSAESEDGTSRQRMTATRVVGGAVLLGPLGALLGGMAKKDKTKVYVALGTPGGAFILEGPAKQKGDAMRFVAAVNAAAGEASRQREQQVARAPRPAPQQFPMPPQRPAPPPRQGPPPGHLGPPQPRPQPMSPQQQVMAQLAQLAQLRDQGVITAQDFEAKKRELLGRL